MPISLSKVDRKLLENTTAEARVLAESACRAALENLAVQEKDYRAHMTVEQRLLRNRLRARGRALDDKRDERSGTQSIYHLTELCAYEHWHRLLFTRFLTENNLLITDAANGSVPVTLEECEELAPELGARDGFDLACRFASLTLPGVFRRDDPVLDLPVALNDQVELRKLLAALPPECFRTDDALGWTYQYWQAQRKKEVNDSGSKIGADELAPVTQLFTEDYMVEFLLHNTLGAWWAGKLGAIKADTEDQARARAALPALDGVPAISWTYLRFVQDRSNQTWLPAGGTLDGWPKSAKLIRLLDPCMGSGHFLVFALSLLVRLRMEEEKSDAKSAVVAVLKDNLFGLELDERCTQIAAFNVALTAWKIAGYQALPSLHLACSGLAPNTKLEDWLKLAGDNELLQNGMDRLYRLFMDAPVLGSLINPRAAEGDLVVAAFPELQPLLERALAQETKDDPAYEMTVTAWGLAKAAEILSSHFTLVTTNVPFLGRPKQNDTLKAFCDRHHPDAKADLGASFIKRGLSFCVSGGNCAFVTPQNWLFQPGYKELREVLLSSSNFSFIAKLGPKGFQTPMWDFNVMLVNIVRVLPTERSVIAGLDVSSARDAASKSASLLYCEIVTASQDEQRHNPDFVISVDPLERSKVLKNFASCVQGLATSDDPQFTILFWELDRIDGGWEGLLGTVPNTVYFGGRERLIHWQDGSGRYFRHAQALKAEGRLGGWKSGTEARGKFGVLVSQMSKMPVTLYTGEFYDHNSSVIVPKDPKHLPAIWAMCSTDGFVKEVRKIDQSLKPSNNVFVKVPFDLPHWEEVSAEKYPDGMPKPFSSDPTQWLLDGHPKTSDQRLHVAVARLVAYEWPRQTGTSFPDCPALGPDGLETFADNDGIICLPAVNREQPAANRLRQLLTAALGAFDEHALVAAAGLKGSKSNTLEDWLREEFFEQHAKLFHDRPFIWHLWDGRSDGFSALVNYHKLDHATLQKLTYSYLGNWIQQQAEDSKADKPGAAARLGAANVLQVKLAAILEGEAPVDVFVRWRPIKDQVQGWHPDINDGVRQNIRPFILAGDVGKRGAGLFRAVPLALKDKDPGKEPLRLKAEYPWFWCEDKPGTDPVGGKDFVGTRWNNVHLTLDKKRKSRA